MNDDRYNQMVERDAIRREQAEELAHAENASRQEDYDAETRRRNDEWDLSR
jgi:hypothetical protein